MQAPKVTPLSTPVAAPREAPKEAPKAEAPAEPATAPTIKAADFNWDGFIDAVEAKNNAISAQLKKTEHRFDGSSLHIYPLKRIVKTIIERPNNRAIIVSVLEGVKLEIHDVDERLEHNENPLVAKISDIMGGAEEVEKNGGKIPF